MNDLRLILKSLTTRMGGHSWWPLAPHIFDGRLIAGDVTVSCASGGYLFEYPSRGSLSLLFHFEEMVVIAIERTELWTSEDGRRIPYREMAAPHLKNAVRKFEKTAPGREEDAAQVLRNQIAGTITDREAMIQLAALTAGPDIVRVGVVALNMEIFRRSCLPPETRPKRSGPVILRTGPGRGRQQKTPGPK